MKTVEAEVRDIVLNILRDGLLRIRACGWNGNADVCANEADHLHNLPALALHPTAKLLSYYLDIEKPCFEKAALNTQIFQPNWQRLQKLAPLMQGSNS